MRAAGNTASERMVIGAALVRPRDVWCQKEVGVAEKVHWDDLSDGRKVGLVVLATVQIGLLVVALWDLAHRSPEEVRGGRRLWAGLVFINWIGPLAYFTVGRKGFIIRLAGRYSRLRVQQQEPDDKTT